MVYLSFVILLRDAVYPSVRHTLGLFVACCRLALSRDHPRSFLPQWIVPSGQPIRRECGAQKRHLANCVVGRDWHLRGAWWLFDVSCGAWRSFATERGNMDLGQAERRDCPGCTYGDSTLQRVSCSDIGGAKAPPAQTTFMNALLSHQSEVLAGDIIEGPDSRVPCLIE